MEMATLITLIINTILTGVLGVGALLLARAAQRVSEELEEINDAKEPVQDPDLLMQKCLRPFCSRAGRLSYAGYCSEACSEA